MKTPSYFNLIENHELEKRIDVAYQILKNCTLCPNNCKVDRNIQKGICRSGIKPIVASFNPHHGEEPPISGIYGSGTIFFGNCTMKCMFCQNYPISQLGTGKELSIRELSEILLYLQQKKCHNINLVTPTHFIPQFLKALLIAVKKGFKLPIVYNTSGYESLETLYLLDGVIDIYLPDMKYADNEQALKYSGIKNYVENNQAAIKEMYSQVDLLKTNSDGIAIKGLIIRHLVLPNKIAGSKKILQFLHNEISNKITIGIMSQYFPAYKATKDKILKYKITAEEYEKIVDFAESLGFDNALIQGLNEKGGA